MTQPLVTPVQVPLTNGSVRSFGHVRLKIAGMDFNGGFTRIMRKRSRKREIAYSNNPDPIGKTLGENSYECRAMMYVDWYYALIATINNNLGPGYTDQPFSIFISYGGVNLNKYTDQVINCTFDDDDGSDEQGTKALTREVNFNPTKILFNGLDDNADPLI